MLLLKILLKMDPNYMKFLEMCGLLDDIKTYLKKHNNYVSKFSEHAPNNMNILSSFVNRAVSQLENDKFPVTSFHSVEDFEGLALITKMQLFCEKMKTLRNGTQNRKVFLSYFASIQKEIRRMRIRPHALPDVLVLKFSTLEDDFFSL